MRLEVDMVVKDAREASEYYKKLLGAKILSTTNEVKGKNETMMQIGDTLIRVLDKNPKLLLFTPRKLGRKSTWMNIWVDDINSYFENITNQGVFVVSPVKEYENNAKMQSSLINIIIHGL